MRGNSDKYQSHAVSRRAFAHVAFLGAVTLLVNPFPASAGEQDDRVFTDSLGRNVYVPTTVCAVMPAGDVAQQLVCTLCPELLSSVASEVSVEDAAEYERAGLGDIVNLPETGGSASSGVSGMVADAASWTGASVILDAGVEKEGLSGELNDLQNEQGVPCLFLDVSFGHLGDAYRKLGDLLGREERAEELASYVEASISRTAVGDGLDENPIRVLYAPRHCGLDMHSGYSVQVDAVTHVGAAPVAAPRLPASAMLDVAKLNNIAIDLVIFDDTDSFDQLKSREGEAWDVWKGCSAIADGAFIVSPALIRSWIGSLVNVQSIGVLWLAYVLRSGVSDSKIVHEAKLFYNLFYGLEIDESELRELIGLC